MLVGLPYVKCKLDLLYGKVSGGSASSILGDNEQEEMQNEELANPDTKPMRKLVIHFIRLFKKIYPIMNFLYHGSNMAYNVAYLFGKTRYYTPWLHLLGLQVKRMSMNDYVSWLVCVHEKKKLTLICKKKSVIIMINQWELHHHLCHC